MNERGAWRVPPLADLLRWTADAGASDLHLAADTPPVIRCDGALDLLPGLSPLTEDDLASILEAVADAREREAFAQQREFDKAIAVDGAGRFRVNVGYERGRPFFAFRRITDGVLSMEDLGLPAVCNRLTQLPRGLVLVTGPTGCGKSTTLASMIDRINEREARHIVTIEDPIEYVHRNKRSIIEQREVGHDTTSFAQALRHVLRQDPDVILVGEMRDLETISAAITAAETGHLVYATLHTPDAPQTVDRIVDVFPSHQQQQVRLQFSMVLEGIVSQVLVPATRDGGRVVACEVLVGTPAIRNLIRESKTHQLGTAMATGAALGMRTLDHDLAELVRRGRVTREAAVAFARSPEEFGRLLGGASYAA
ncbi:MAG: type IV pilus twitching motility protein PilT [Dehalococcoidia bacterium]|nr:MAG: type IV pilus twitching motility protein PilT [Dehalococcoidia bacterium]